MDFLLGTFNTKTIYTIRFHPPSSSNPHPSLAIVQKSKALGSHSWLSLSPSNPHKHLYATAWTTPPSIAAYTISPETHSVTLINSAPIKSTSGYVCASETHVYSAGGPSGEVFMLRNDGGIGDLIQELDFVDKKTEGGVGSKDAHGNFGGLRHGAHSVDLSPDGQKLYIADIGRNCIWVYNVAADGGLKLARKEISPRTNDGPRHTTPHPNNKTVYSLQEHSCMVDAFSVTDQGGGLRLQHTHGVRIIPESEDEGEYWADEVRLSPGREPGYLWASTRGLKAETRGWVSVFEVRNDGGIGPLKAMWRTPTSGGIANAVEPAPEVEGGVEYAALTDSEEGLVMVLGFDGQEIREVARLKLSPEEGEGVKVVKGATAVWL